MIPSWKERPSMTSVIFSYLRKRLHFKDADCARLNIIAKLARYPASGKKRAKSKAEISEFKVTVHTPNNSFGVG